MKHTQEKPGWMGNPSEIEVGDLLRFIEIDGELRTLESPHLAQICLAVLEINYFGGYYFITVNHDSHKVVVQHNRSKLIAFGDYLPSRRQYKIAKKLDNLNID